MKGEKEVLNTQQDMKSSYKEGGHLMAYQMTLTLTDQEYQMLAAEAARRGE